MGFVSDFFQLERIHAARTDSFATAVAEDTFLAEAEEIAMLDQPDRSLACGAGVLTILERKITH
jgi:hypothetical protein